MTKVLSVLGLILVALLLTFSRSAWIGSFVMVAVALFLGLPRRLVWKAAGAGAACAAVIAVAMAVAFPSIVARAGSGGHLERPLEALRTMRDHPFGLGLGAAGPASNRVSDTCVDTEDPSWAKDRTDLCVFVGGRQVQPTDRACQCPLLTENWYLQIGVELGWIGFALFVALVGAVFIRFRQRLRIAAAAEDGLARPLLLAFVGISIAALFLHAWEDSAVAYTVWVLLAIVMGGRCERPTGLRS